MDKITKDVKESCVDVNRATLRRGENKLVNLCKDTFVFLVFFVLWAMVMPVVLFVIVLVAVTVVVVVVMIVTVVVAMG
mgnify:CR=1 FL=1